MAIHFRTADGKQALGQIVLPPYTHCGTAAVVDIRPKRVNLTFPVPSSYAGKIPASIGLLVDLDKLDLRGNKLNGEFEYAKWPVSWHEI